MRVRSDFAALKANLASVTTQADLSRQSLAAAQADFDRKTQLLSNRISTPSDLDKSRVALIAAKTQLELLEQQERTLRIQLLDDPSLAIEKYPQFIEATVALDRAERDLHNTVLRAPIAGVATQVASIQMGRFLTAGTAVFSVISSDNVWIDANPKETDLTYVRRGQPVTITVDAFPDKEWSGTVGAISPGTGAQFAILPPQNAAGNWIKIVQRVPMRIEFAPGTGPAAAAGRHERHRRDRHRPARQARPPARLERGGTGPRSMIGAAGRAHGLTPSMQRLLVTISVMMATIMQVLDITIANVSLPYMQGSLSATIDQVSWVLTSYVVAAAVMTAPVGWLAARFGIKKLLITCVTGFTIASMLCGIAQSIEEIVAFRIVQGMFGAALVPLSQTVMLQIYPPEQRGWAMSLWGMGVMIGPIMGPILGGWLTENYTWRWIFFINLPFGIATTFGLLAFMDETEGNRAPVVRLVRICRAQHRHRCLATDARSRRTAGMVRLHMRSL